MNDRTCQPSTAWRSPTLRSAVAVTVANRNLAGINQGSVSADTNLLFGKTFNFTGQVVKSWGLFGQGTEAFYVRPSYDSPTARHSPGPHCCASSACVPFPASRS